MSETNGQCQIDSSVMRFLQICSDQYDVLLEETVLLSKRGSTESVLTMIELVAGFAGMNHPGRFADGAIENIALELGRALPPTSRWGIEPAWSAGARHQKTTRRRILHVSTTVRDIGGHSRMILNWIHMDPDSQHSLLLTNHGPTHIPSALSEAVVLSGGQFIAFPQSAPIVERARWLRRFAAETADLIILHLVPNDIIPIVAFANNSDLPVGLINLADQCFWMGSSVADAVIHLREIGYSTSHEFRFTRNDQLLPIPICDFTSTLRRSEARKELSIPESQIMLLSIGRSIKYAPSNRQNFFRTARKILDHNHQAHLYLVGVKRDDHIRSPGFVDHDRMHFVGPVENPIAYQAAADVYLEGFPFGSQTALLESILPGIPCVPAFAPATPLLATHDFALTGLVENPASEEEYIERASDFISDRNKRLQIGSKLRERVHHYHIGESWRQYLNKLYRVLENLKHSSEAIPYSAGARRPVDFAISEYHATRLTAVNRAEVIKNEVYQGMISSSYWLRQRGFHGDSFRMLQIANRNRGWDTKTLLSVAKLIPHRIMYSFSKKLKFQ